MEGNFTALFISSDYYKLFIVFYYHSTKVRFSCFCFSMKVLFFWSITSETSKAEQFAKSSKNLKSVVDSLKKTVCCITNFTIHNKTAQWPKK